MSKTIVWIEDDTDIIDPVVRPLERAGHNIRRINTVEQALASLDEIRNSDLILLDMFLPTGEAEGPFSHYPGLDLLQLLRDEHGIATPVVAFSVVTNSVVHTKLLRLDVKSIVRKPVLPSELKAAVDRALSEEWQDR